MKKFLAVLIVLALTGWSVAANELIPVRHFFEHAKFNNMKVSPDGKHIAFTFQEDTEVKLAVMKLSNMAVTASFAFGENMHVVNFHWGNKSRVLLEVAKRTGNLDTMNGSRVKLYAANIDGTRRLELFGSGMSGYTILHLLPDQPDKILIGKMHFSEVERNGWRAFTIDINRAKERYLDDQPQGLIAGLIADNSGAIRIGIEYIEGETFDDNKTVIHYKKNDSWQQLDLPSKRANPNVRPLGFSADNSRAYFSSNHDMAEGDVAGVFVYDFNTSEVSLIARHAYSDVGRAFYSHQGDVLAVDYMATNNEVEFINREHRDAKLLAGLQAAFPGQAVAITSFDRAGKTALFRVSSDVNPGEFYLYDTENGQARYLASALGKLKKEQLQPMQQISFTARDGKMIRGLLTLPDNADKNLPLIVNVHGGPFGPFDSWGFNNEVQYLANRGYAVLQINFRGSGGYGDDFQRAGRLQWGHAMQDDVTDGTLWAIEQGIADKERICIYGGSYGGYAALWGVIKEPDLYKCSVGYVGVYDMPLFFDGDGSDASRSSSIEQYISSHVGEGDEYMRSISPVHHVDKIKAELFIVHGSKDVRVPIVHANNLKKALDDIGKPYEWLVKEDGHGFFKVDHRVELYTQMAAFFDKHIGKAE
ncbi:Prolyl oligopeptidase family protein [Arsukibacterium tuosuense]|uniref:Prolyl oligopeptidase family protein n=1 Tax=Arsukibacterium tuosuense TaxID=1323745 RepID=A0A285J5F1_9GAMM|nr:S9 family peptidase [Arsukibacterium tuosuense]SNY55293.1 Prolyl oligopeptidase family protein [Arsukibacterium tuosuense]